MNGEEFASPGFARYFPMNAEEFVDFTQTRLAGFAGDGAAFQLGHAAGGVSRHLLATFDERGVDRAGA
jgi:hypothetical protein